MSKLNAIVADILGLDGVGLTCELDPETDGGYVARWTMDTDALDRVRRGLRNMGHAVSVSSDGGEEYLWVVLGGAS